MVTAGLDGKIHLYGWGLKDPEEVGDVPAVDVQICYSREAAFGLYYRFGGYVIEFHIGHFPVEREVWTTVGHLRYDGVSAAGPVLGSYHEAAKAFREEPSQVVAVAYLDEIQIKIARSMLYEG